MFGTCTSDGCDESAAMLNNRCLFHSVIEDARRLSPAQFDDLRATLATTPPLSEDERRSRRVKSALWSVEWNARDLRRNKRRAREVGATKGQVLEAAKRGRKQADA